MGLGHQDTLTSFIIFLVVFHLAAVLFTFWRLAKTKHSMSSRVDLKEH